MLHGRSDFSVVPVATSSFFFLYSFNFLLLKRATGWPGSPALPASTLGHALPLCTPRDQQDFLFRLLVLFLFVYLIFSHLQEVPSDFSIISGLILLQKWYFGRVLPFWVFPRRGPPSCSNQQRCTPPCCAFSSALEPFHGLALSASSSQPLT